MLIHPKSFEKPLKTPQAQAEAITIVSNYLRTRYAHIQEMADKKRIPDAFRGLLMPQYMKLAACVPYYADGGGTVVRYWLLRYVFI